MAPLREGSTGVPSGHERSAAIKAKPTSRSGPGVSVRASAPFRKACMRPSDERASCADWRTRGRKSSGERSRFTAERTVMAVRSERRRPRSTCVVRRATVTRVGVDENTAASSERSRTSARDCRSSSLRASPSRAPKATSQAWSLIGLMASSSSRTRRTRTSRLRSRPSWIANVRRAIQRLAASIRPTTPMPGSSASAPTSERRSASATTTCSGANQSA